MTKLKPCPFCGKKPIPKKDELGKDYAVQRHTRKCPMSSVSDFIFDFAAWDRRKP